MPLLGKLLKQFIEARNDLNLRPYYPLRNQKNMLKKLLTKAEFTAFGRAYAFTEILQSKNIQEEFRQRVPIFDYNSIYKNWWYRAMIGESDV
jgi:hypothetical protein